MKIANPKGMYQKHEVLVRFYDAPAWTIRVANDACYTTLPIPANFRMNRDDVLFGNDGMLCYEPLDAC